MMDRKTKERQNFVDGVAFAVLQLHETKRGAEMKKSEILEKALDAVKARGESYGAVTENFQRIADFWNVWLTHRGLLADGERLKPRDVAMLNDLQKTARLLETPDHEDSIVDKAGYAACYAVCVESPFVSVQEFIESLDKKNPK